MRRALLKLFRSSGSVLGMLRTVSVVGDDLLGLGRIQVVEILCRESPDLRSARIDVLVDDGHGRLGENRHRRDDDVERVGSEFLDGEDGLVLPCEKHVADLALHERRRGAACAGIEDGHMGVELTQVIGRDLLGLLHLVLELRIAHLLDVAELAFEDVAPRGELVPSRAAGRLRVRGDHLDAGLDEVLPRLEALGVALADEEDDCRGVGRRVERELRLPVAVDELAAGERDRVDVIAERERHDVGLYAVDYRAGLLSAAAVRLLDDDLLSRLVLPVARELLVVGAVELARRVVGDVQELDRSRESDAGDKGGRCRCDEFLVHVGDPFLSTLFFIASAPAFQKLNVALRPTT